VKVFPHACCELTRLFFSQTGKVLPDFSTEGTQEGGILKSAFEKSAPVMLSGAQKLAADVAGVKWLVEDARPLTATSTPAFTAYMHAATGGRYGGACYSTNRSIVTKLAQESKDRASSFLASLETDNVKPSLSGDCWSSNGVAIFGIKAHAIDKDWKLRSCLVGALPCGLDRHTGDFLDKATDSAMEKLGFTNNVDGIFIKVGDNAANQVKAWKNDGMIGCAAHTLQLSEKLYAAAGNGFNNLVLSKGSGLVGHFNQSTVGKNELHVYQKQLQIPETSLEQRVATRFNSTLKMCRSLVQSKSAIILYDVNATDPGEVFKSSKLTTHEWDVIEETAACLQTAHDAVKLLEGDKYVTSSLVLPAIHKVMVSLLPSTNVILSTRQPSDSRYRLASSELCKSVREGRAAMLADVKTRFITEVSDIQKKTHLISCGLDPRFHNFDWIEGSVFPSAWKETGLSLLKREFVIFWTGRKIQTVSSDKDTVNESDEIGTPSMRLTAPVIASKKTLKDPGVSFSSFFDDFGRWVPLDPWICSSFRL
jgi:hypothetical protein